MIIVRGGEGRYVDYVAVCLIWTPEENNDQHDKIGQYFPWRRVCQYYIVQHTVKLYEHLPEAVIENHKLTIHLYITIDNEGHTNGKRPNIVIKVAKQKIISHRYGSDIR